MKITVDLADFELDENNSFEAGFKEYIIREVYHSIWKSTDKKAVEQMEREIKNMIDQNLLKQTTKRIGELIEEGTMENPDNRKERITIMAYVQKKFENQSSWGSPADKIEKLAKQFGEDMKKRYDFAFASQVVIKMGEQGLLKEGVIEALLKK